MNYYATASFLKVCKALPLEIQSLLYQKYNALKADPRQLSAHLKRVGNLWSVQLNSDFRLLGVSVKDGILWFWIGPRKKA